MSRESKERYYTVELFCFHNPGGVIEENFPGDHIHMKVVEVHNSKPLSLAREKVLSIRPTISKPKYSQSAGNVGFVVFQAGTKEGLLKYKAQEQHSCNGHADRHTADYIKTRSHRGLGTEPFLAVESLQEKTRDGNFSMRASTFNDAKEIISKDIDDKTKIEFWTGGRRAVMPGKSIPTPKAYIQDTNFDRVSLTNMFSELATKNAAFSGPCVLKGLAIISESELLARVAKCSNTLQQAVETELKIGTNPENGTKYPTILKAGDVAHVHSLKCDSVSLKVLPVDAVVLKTVAADDERVIYTRKGISAPPGKWAFDYNLSRASISSSL